MYQDEKMNLERENLVLTVNFRFFKLFKPTFQEKLEKLVQSAGTFQMDGYPTLHVNCFNINFKEVALN